jgi:proline utilization trans-activator
MKIKCSGETPCRNCRLSSGKPECTYRIKDRKVQVSEKYLRTLEAEITALKKTGSSSEISTASDGSAPPIARLASGTELEAQVDYNVANPLFDETIGFVDDGDVSKRTYVGEAATATFETRVRQMIRSDPTSSTPSGSLYFNDRALLRVTSSRYQLPNRTYATLLVQTLLQFVGSNYHLMTEQSFLKKMDETYAGDHLEPHWLARLFAIFALGELYLNKTSTMNSDAKVPGAHFFVQATTLFPDLYEEVDLAYIETLIAMVREMHFRPSFNANATIRHSIQML